MDLNDSKSTPRERAIQIVNVSPMSPMFDNNVLCSLFCLFDLYHDFPSEYSLSVSPSASASASPSASRTDATLFWKRVRPELLFHLRTSITDAKTNTLPTSIEIEDVKNYLDYVVCL